MWCQPMRRLGDSPSCHRLQPRRSRRLCGVSRLVPAAVPEHPDHDSGVSRAPTTLSELVQSQAAYARENQAVGERGRSLASSYAAGVGPPHPVVTAANKYGGGFGFALAVFAAAAALFVAVTGLLTFARRFFYLLNDDAKAASIMARRGGAAPEANPLPQQTGNLSLPGAAVDDASPSRRNTQAPPSTSAPAPPIPVTAATRTQVWDRSDVASSDAPEASISGAADRRGGAVGGERPARTGRRRRGADLDALDDFALGATSHRVRARRLGSLDALDAALDGIDAGTRGDGADAATSGDERREWASEEERERAILAEIWGDSLRPEPAWASLDRVFLVQAAKERAFTGSIADLVTFNAGFRRGALRPVFLAFAEAEHATTFLEALEDWGAAGLCPTAQHIHGHLQSMLFAVNARNLEVATEEREVVLVPPELLAPECRGDYASFRRGMQRACEEQLLDAAPAVPLSHFNATTMLAPDAVSEAAIRMETWRRLGSAAARKADRRGGRGPSGHAPEADDAHDPGARSDAATRKHSDDASARGGWPASVSAGARSRDSLAAEPLSEKRSAAVAGAVGGATTSGEGGGSSEHGARVGGGRPPREHVGASSSAWSAPSRAAGGADGPRGAAPGTANARRSTSAVRREHAESAFDDDSLGVRDAEGNLMRALPEHQADASLLMEDEDVRRLPFLFTVAVESAFTDVRSMLQLNVSPDPESMDNVIAGFEDRADAVAVYTIMQAHGPSSPGHQYKVRVMDPEDVASEIGQDLATLLVFKKGFYKRAKLHPSTSPDELYTICYGARMAKLVEPQLELSSN